ARSFPPCPRVCGQDLVESRMLDHLVTVHRSANSFRNLRDVNAAAQKLLDSYFVRSVEHGRQRPANLACSTCQVQSGEPVEIGLFKGQAAQLCEIGLHSL